MALNMEREVLYERINQRVDKMINDGLVEEVRQLMHLRNTNVMKTVGYKEIFQHLDGIATLDEAADLIKRNTRKYARKQITWFRKDSLYPWFVPDDPGKLIQYCEGEMD